MTGETAGPFRVLTGRTDDEWLLLDVESADPVYVSRSSLPAVSVGNRIDGDLVWDGEEPMLGDVVVETDTRFRFRRTDEPIFESARTCFESARAEGEAMSSRVTYDTDRNPNGVVYTFADGPSAPDLFSAFRRGHKPLDPLVARAAEGSDPPFSVWVLAPSDPYVIVYIVLDPDGLLDRTMTDTYDRDTRVGNSQK